MTLRPASPEITRVPLARVPYAVALERQRELVGRRIAGDCPDLVWYLEHSPVVSWNPGRGDRHLRWSVERLAAEGVDVVPTDRGGDVTYHGPGQLVGYLILDLAAGQLARKDVHEYLRLLEESLIQALARWKMEGFRVSGRTGVWLAPFGSAGHAPAEGSPAPEKVAALGVRARRWISSHGFALNVSCDLRPFREYIVPCGIGDAGVTSMAERIGRGHPAVGEVVGTVHGALETCLGRRLAVSLDGRNLLDRDQIGMTSA